MAGEVSADELMAGGQMTLAGMPEPPTPQERARASLGERFGLPPFSVLDARAGYWQQRKAAWQGLGIQSEVGRRADLLGKPTEEVDDVEGLLSGTRRVRNGAYGASVREAADGTLEYKTTVGSTSIFDPVLCEALVRWFSLEEGLVLDPFAGGSVRGIVSGYLRRHYLGIDLRLEQVEANEQQVRALGLDGSVRYEVGDTLDVLPALLEERGEGWADGVLTCPPYYDLEVYSDDPADLANLPKQEFDQALRGVADYTYAACRENRFSTWVVGDVRGKDGTYKGLPQATIEAHEDVGWRLYNDAILVTPVGSLAIRVGRHFHAGRKLGSSHQRVLTFYKGDTKAIKGTFGPVLMGDPAADAAAVEAFREAE